MKRILLIAQAFPPVGGSHVSRVVALQQSLSRRFNVTGMSIKIGRKYPVIDDSVSLVIPVIRIYPGLMHRISHGSFDINQVESESSANYNSTKTKSNITMNLFYTYLNTLVKRFEVVDSYSDWILHLYLGIRRSITKETILVSSSMPNSVHVATLISLLGRNNFWWADFGDPWTLNVSLPRHGIRKYIEKMLEKFIVRRANLITFTTKTTLSDYVDHYPEFSTKMKLFRMGYNTEDDIYPSIDISKDSVYYGGSLPKENRDSREFIKTILRMKNVTFIFSGQSTEAIRDLFKENIPSNVRLLTWLNHGEFISYLKSSTVCVIFGNSNYQQVPGKIYHYAAYARNILYISAMDAENDESLELLGDRCEVAFNDSLSIEIKINKLLEESKFHINDTKHLTWAYALDPLVELIDQLDT
jgi:hypothetical protein